MQKIFFMKPLFDLIVLQLCNLFKRMIRKTARHGLKTIAPMQAVV